jgi:hypothetical protein
MRPIESIPQPQSPAQAELRRRQDALLDDALRETFPASDPISVMQLI